MWIFSKISFIVFSFVMLQIFKIIIKGFQSLLLSVCNELEITLKGEESTTFNRNAANTFSNQGASSTSLQTSESAKRNRNAATTHFAISDSSEDKRVTEEDRNLVIGNVSDSSNVPTNDIRNTYVAIKENSHTNWLDSFDSSPVHSAVYQYDLNRVPDDPLQDLINTVLYKVRMTLQSKSIFSENITGNFPVETESSSSETANIIPKSPVYKLNSSDQDLVLKFGKKDNGKNEIAESDPLNTTKPILRQMNSKYLQPVTTSGERQDIIQSSKKQMEIVINEGDNVDNTTCSPSPFADECVRENDIQFSKTSINDAQVCSQFENTEQVINKPDLGVTDSISMDAINKAAQFEGEQIALSKITKTLSYVDYLKAKIPIIHALESKVIFFCKKNYKKSILYSEDFASVNPEISNLLYRYKTLPYQNIILKYVFEIGIITKNLRNYLELSVNTKNRMTLSFCLRKLALSLENARRILFDVNEEAIKVGRQMEKVTALLKNKRRK